MVANWNLLGSVGDLYCFSNTHSMPVTHEIITFQDICRDKIPKDFTSIKDTYYAALTCSSPWIIDCL